MNPTPTTTVPPIPKPIPFPVPSSIGDDTPLPGEKIEDEEKEKVPTLQ